ncbi:NDP-hexose 2,3-dehydratase family protein [Streptacidiphilus sp. EB103A]|uniref:NDP-hexose 2,3-dehydratase family protein n=1 Tax=Streptacidiphilus sp. EB103A TaxID=3156275 RepID=UPI00351663C1
MPESSVTGLLHRSGSLLTARLAASATAVEGEVMSDDQFFAWLAGRQRAHVQNVRRVAFDELSGWDFDPGTGNLQHRSGRFYSVQGLQVRTGFGPAREWMQPIINQPEIGILGIAVREINGVLHCLMQAKAEPGNVNGVQLSPTVQATKSNYSRVHGGSAVPYLDCFRTGDSGRAKVLADVLQSEQGSWFYCKRNRNMVVEVGPEVEAAEDFCWLTIRQINSLLRHENLLNMDARTVLSCMPDWRVGAGAEDGGRGSLHSDVEIRSWITSRQSEHELTAVLLPLREVERTAGSGWKRTEEAISHERGLFFSIIGVDVSSSHREVAAWTQPLLEPLGGGIIALLVKRFGGVLHTLISAHVEPGYLDVVELGPTVQCTPENYAHLSAEDQPPFLDVVRDRRPEQTLFDTMLSEEGGRFYQAENRYLIIEADEDFPARTPEDFRWMTLRQLTELLKYSHYLNVQARTLVAALRTLQEVEDSDADHR